MIKKAATKDKNNIPRKKGQEYKRFDIMAAKREISDVLMVKSTVLQLQDI